MMPYKNPKIVKHEIKIPHDILVRIYNDVQAMIEDIPEAIPSISVSQFAEENRILPRGTPYPGPWRNSRTPYLVDIMNDLSANSPIQEVILAKSAQVGATAGPIENLIAYIIKNVPGPTLFVTANEKLLNKWINKRLSPLLISCGLTEKIFAQHLMKGQRRTGNQMFSKEFPGGSLDMVTANSAANLRSDSIRNVLFDEVDSYPWNVDGEGDPIEIARARTKAWKKRKKILIQSTPTTYEDSHIWPLYESGDQRRYFVPCPYCGKEQLLEFGEDETNYGLRWETKAGLLDYRSIHYQCENCKEPIFERDKYEMVQNGFWKPTAKSSAPFRRSYHISAIYSLLEEWSSIVQSHINVETDPLKQRAHTNLNLGLPYKELGARPSIESVIALRGTYKRGTVPHGVLFLTAALDVQTGSKKDKRNPERLELEICGHGIGYRTWSIEYKVFKGSVQNGFKGAWEDLYNWIMEKGGFRFYRSDGFEFNPRLFFADSSDGKTENIVFDFCSRLPNTFPIKGAGTLKKTTSGINQYIDEEKNSDSDRFRERKKGDVIYYMISTNWYKKIIYRSLRIPRQEGNTQPARFCDFPKEYNKEYFKMLTAEEEREDGSFWKPTGRRNEALDLRVYNLCAQEIWLASELKKAREKLVRKGASKIESEKLNTRHVLDYLAKMTARKNLE